MKRIGAPSRDTVLEAIAASLRQEGASLERTARRLGISVRSLQRRLAEKATSHSELVALVRVEEACRSLAKSDERIADISARLGYAGPSSFSRAFMRLKKTQPRIYRQEHQSQVRDCRRAS